MNVLPKLVVLLLGLTISWMIYAKKELPIQDHSIRQDIRFINYLLAMIYVESGWKPTAISHKGAKGLLQVTNIAAREIQNTVRRYLAKSFRSEREQQFISHCQFSLDKLLQIRDNITAGSCYFELMLYRHDGNYIKALAAYNGGTRQVLRLENGKQLVDETSNYIIKVLLQMEEVE